VESVFHVPSFLSLSQPIEATASCTRPSRDPKTPKPEPPKPCAQRPNRCTQGFVLCAQPLDLRVRPSRPRSGKVRSIVRDAFRVGREGFPVARNRLTLTLDVGDLRGPRLSALRFGVFRLRAGLNRLRAKVAGLRAKGKPLRAVSRPLRARVGSIAGSGGE
jgi:hypothetical protein